MKHITLLLKLERQGLIHFSRINANTLSISAIGYKPQELAYAELALLKLGCRYDFGCLQEFDSVSGRTFTHMTEPETK